MNSAPDGCNNAEAQAFPGIHCVLYALFNNSGTLDSRAHKRQIAFALAAGADGCGGLEMIDSLSTGCAGLIVAPEAIDPVVKIITSWQAGNRDTATKQYARQLPAAGVVKP